MGAVVFEKVHFIILINDFGCPVEDSFYTVNIGTHDLLIGGQQKF